MNFLNVIIIEEDNIEENKVNELDYDHDYDESYFYQ
jgi:hypothetical protein